jgi:hypothetical protein
VSLSRADLPSLCQRAEALSHALSKNLPFRISPAAFDAMLAMCRDHGRDVSLGLSAFAEDMDGDVQDAVGKFWKLAKHLSERYFRSKDGHEQPTYTALTPSEVATFRDELREIEIALTFRASEHDPRDKYCYEQIADGTPLKTIREGVTLRKWWEPIDTVQGVTHAAKRYAVRHSLRWPPRRIV